MSKRYIGIDIEDGTLQLAIASGDRKQLQLQPIISRPLPEPAALPELLKELLGATAGFGDRLLVSLPARQAYLRWLSFPFRDHKKLTSAIELELSVQLPVDVDNFILSHRDLHDPQQPGRLVAAAIPTELLATTLSHFDDESWPAHLVDLAPFAVADGLDKAADGDLLVLADSQETAVGRLRNHTLETLALLPATAEQQADEVAAFVSRQLRMLRGGSQEEKPRCWLVASRHARQLQQTLQQLQLEVAVPTLPGEEPAVNRPGLKAALLALAAARQDKKPGFNLRQGRFALRGEWQKLRRSLLAVGILGGLLLVSLGASAWLQYADLSKRADQVSKQLEQVFRRDFSRTDPIVDIPLQIQAKLAEMRQKTALLGLSSDTSALKVLQEISQRLPADLPLEIRELNYASDSLRLGGFTSSFDAANQAARALQASPLFSEAKISDAKMSLDGSRVDFQLQLKYRQGGTP